MGGKGGKTTVGYWYKVAYQAGIGIGPIDAFLEFRGGDKTAWSGNITSSGTITIDAPSLWGGEKDQGGITGDVDVMFGEATQQPNAYMLSTFGPQQPAWRGLATLVFKGGRYGAMNPYPQKPSYKFVRITKGWDNDMCWYPETASITGQANITPAGGSWRYKVASVNDGAAYYTEGFDDSSWDPGVAPFANIFNPAAAAAGYSGQPGTVIPCDPSVYIWMRGRFSLNTLPSSLQFDAFVDNDIEVWINGVHVLTDGSNVSHHLLQTIAANSYRTGDNQITVRLHERLPFSPGNCTYFDCKFFDNVPGPKYMNPAHILYYARTQQDMGREPTANMNDASFRTAADWYYAQGFGLCTAYDPAAETLDDFIARIEKVAGCSMSRSPTDGQWYLDVANGVYDLASLPKLTDDDILDFAETPSTMDSAVNSVSIEYFDPAANESVTTAPVQALALIDAFGTIGDQVTYSEIPSSDLALRVATRDLLASVTPTRAFDITTTRLPYAWRVGTYFRLQAPKRGIADMVCLLAEKSSGTLKSGAIKITASQDIYSLPATAFVDTEHGVDTRPSQVPFAAVSQLAVEAPYLDLVRTLSRADLQALPGDAGYLMTMAADPATSLDYTITASSDGGTTWAGSATALFTPTALVVGSDALSGGSPVTVFSLSGGVALSSVQIGSAALWGSEIVRVDAIDVVAATVTLGRGCTDTPPVPHAANERIWFFDDFNGTDGVEYAEGETVDVKLLTNTGNAQLNASSATMMAVAFNGRQARPYAPGKLLVNGSPYPSAAISPVSISWAHRDRATQADQLIDTSAASIGPEAGVTYTVRTYLNGTLDSTATGITGTSAAITPSGFGTVRVEVDAVRSGLASWKPLTATFAFNANLQVTSASPIKFVAGTASTFQLAATGGLPPLSWSVDASTALPSGITMSTAGLITFDGTTPGGDTVVKFIVSDSASNSTTAPLTIDVAVQFVNAVDLLSPVAHWRMDQVSGATAVVDRVASVSAPLTGTAGTNFTLGVTGLLKNDSDTAVTFSGGYATTAADAKWALGTGDFSAFCIAKWTTTSFYTVGGVRDPTSSVLFLFTVNRVTTGQVGVEGWNWSSNKLLASDKAYNDGKPHALGVTYEAATNTMRLYVDGTLKVTQVQTGGLTRPTLATMRSYIANNAGSQTFFGTVDEYVLFNHKLSDSDMATLAAFASAT